MMTPQEAIDVIKRERNKSHWDNFDELKQASDAWKMVFEALEKQIQKNGKWIHDGHHIICDQCGTTMCDKDREGDTIPQNYCPNCGAKMEGEG